MRAAQDGRDSSGRGRGGVEMSQMAFGGVAANTAAVSVPRSAPVACNTGEVMQALSRAAAVRASCPYPNVDPNPAGVPPRVLREHRAGSSVVRAADS
jgi:hypothetical protein